MGCVTLNSRSQVLIAGLEKSGKSFFLYSRLKNFITGKTDIITKSTQCIEYN